MQTSTQLLNMYSSDRIIENRQPILFEQTIYFTNPAMYIIKTKTSEESTFIISLYPCDNVI